MFTTIRKFILKRYRLGFLPDPDPLDFVNLETSVSLPYLDVIVTINSNGIMSVNVFHKLDGAPMMETIFVREVRIENHFWKIACH